MLIERKITKNIRFLAQKSRQKYFFSIKKQFF